MNKLFGLRVGHLTVVQAVQPLPVNHAPKMGWIAFKGGISLYADKVIMSANEAVSKTSRPRRRRKNKRTQEGGLNALKMPYSKSILVHQSTSGG
ncbi:hypothetical protein LIER_44115 [Lithospermum erythrorhizon]|uniref:Uncharacterized protein n=1 Tax=Lithospermum erythrorhizon TaxID=34254 RepID=A0AAV3PU88_LITER